MIGYAKDLKRTGLPFDSATSAGYDALSPADFKRLVVGEPRRLTKQSAAIQIADLYLYPMIKAGYVPSYPPFQKLMANMRVIDALLTADERSKRGIKYSCFDTKKRKA